MTASQWAAIAASVAVVALAGCAGDDEPGGAYTSSDVQRLAGIAPVTPGWPPWPPKPQAKQSSDESPEEAAAQDPIYAAYRRKTADLGDSRGSSNTWADDDKLGNLVVEAFDTPADAHVSFLASNDLSRAYGAKYGFVVRAEKVDGLGDEAWRLWTHWNGRQVTYHWRRDKLWVEVHVHCYGGCGPDTDSEVDAAARTWVDAIDAEA